MDQPVTAIHSAPDSIAASDPVTAHSSPHRSWRKRLGLACLALALTPFVLTLIYAVVPPISLPMLGRALLMRDVDRRWKPLEQISPVLAQAVITSEDARFCSHSGVDFGAIADVLQNSGNSGPTRGASTISMQVAKNLYLWPLPTWLRKPVEIPVALWIDLVWPKRRVIEVYLNIAEWGDGVFGAEAAARAHFNKSAQALTLREAALLAAALPNPINRDASDPNRHMRIVASIIATRVNGASSVASCIK